MSSAIFVAHKHPFCGHLQSAIDAKILSLLHLKSQKSSAYNSFKRFRHTARENLIPREYYNNTARVCKGKLLSEPALTRFTFCHLTVPSRRNKIIIRISSSLRTIFAPAGKSVLRMEVFPKYYEKKSNRIPRGTGLSDPPGTFKRCRTAFRRQADGVD